MMPRMSREQSSAGSCRRSAVGSCSLAATVVAVGLLAAGVGHAQKRQRLNPMIDLLEQKKPVFGVYWPSNPSGRGRAGSEAEAPQFDHRATRAEQAGLRRLRAEQRRTPRRTGDAAVRARSREGRDRVP